MTINESEDPIVKGILSPITGSIGWTELLLITGGIGCIIGLVVVLLKERKSLDDLFETEPQKIFLAVGIGFTVGMIVAACHHSFFG